nr:DUF1801 domain-containing protein [Propionicimonas sp.]
MTAQDVQEYVAAVVPEVRRRDAAVLVDLLRRVTGEEPRLWGSIIGAGHYHYRYDSGREGDGPSASFAPRKAVTSVYLLDGVSAHAERLARLGSHRSAVGCLYLTDLAKVDLAVLEEIIAASHRTLTAGTFGNRARDSAAAGD